jgi:hypothetical protein
MFDGERLPDNLGTMAPGQDVGVVLADIDREKLSGHDRVIVMQACARQVAHYQAQFYSDVQGVWEAERHVSDQTMAGLRAEGLSWSSEIDEMASAEVRAALTLTRCSADLVVGIAYDLRVRQPAVWVALNEGRIDIAKARVICDQTCHLDVELARRVADQALDRASTQTTGQLAARLRRLCIAVDPDSAKERYEARLVDRKLVVQATEDGTANLFAFDLPAAEANLAYRRIDRLAKAAKTADDPRTIDQVRADVLLDLLTGEVSSRPTGRSGGAIELRVDLTTLAGLDESPGEIPGWGPVIADIARQVSEGRPGNQWRFTVTGADGDFVCSGTTRRRPTADQRRQVEARNPTCVFPGCRMPASAADLDHNHPWAEYHRTATDDLAPLCRHDHITRHQRGWTVKRSRPGVYVWISPLGHSYTVQPEPP